MAISTQMRVVWTACRLSQPEPHVERAGLTAKSHATQDCRAAHQVAGGHGGAGQRGDDQDGGQAAGEDDGLPRIERRADDLGRDAGPLEALQQLVVLRHLQRLPPPKGTAWGDEPSAVDPGTSGAGCAAAGCMIAVTAG